MEANDATSVNIRTVLVSRAVNLIKIPINQPPFARVGLLADQFLEEAVFKAASRRAVHGSELEGFTRRGEGDFGREEEIINVHILNFDKIFVLEKKDSASSANRQALSKTL